jgi:hypothetical protein
MSINFGSFKSPGGRSPEYDRLLDILGNIPILQGRLIEDVSLSTAETLVPHKLGSAYRGWVITNINADATVHVSSETLSERYLALTASASCIVSLWVF